MLAGGHRCLGSNVSSSSLETAAAATAANLPLQLPLSLPNEPLLFLYPRWFTSSDALKVKRTHKLARPVHRWPSLGPLIKQRKPPSPSSPLPPGPAQSHVINPRRCYSSSSSTAQQQALSDLHTEKKASQLADTSSVSLAPGDTTVASSSSAPSETCDSQSLHRDSTMSLPKGSKSKSNCKHSFEFDIASNFRPHYGFETDFHAMSNIDPPRIIHPTRRLSGTVKARKAADQQHWREILDILLELSKPTATTEDPSTIEEVMIPETTVVKLLGDVGENKFYLNNLSGCMVHVLPRTNDFNGTHRKVILHGSPVSRRMSLQMLQDAVAETPLKGELSSSSSSSSSSSLPQSLKISFAWDTSHIPKIQPQRADTFPLPRTWTLQSFNHFVNDLTSIPMAHSAHRILYKYGERHTKVLRNILYHLFDDPATASLISTHALNVLIDFFDKNGSLPQFWALYHRVEPFMTTRSFNTLLEHAALKGDLRLFHDIINKMKKAEIKPNGLTWVCFLKSSRLRAARTSIFGTMYQLGLLENKHFLQSAVPTIISRDYFVCTRRGMTVSEFIGYVNSKLGPNWFSGMAARELIYVSVMFRNSASIRAVLQQCERSGVIPDSWTLSQILRHYIKTRDFIGGMTFFFRAYKHCKLRADHETLNCLFSLAWTCQAVNACRVIWWYACLHRKATWSMRSKVIRSLENNANPDSGNQVQHWNATAGKLIVGIEHRPLLQILKRKTNASFRAFIEAGRPEGYFKKYPLRIIDQLGIYVPKGTLRLQQRHIAQRIVKADLDAILRRTTNAPFIRILIDAANMDARSDGLSSSDESAEKMIEIPLSKRTIRGRKGRRNVRNAERNSNEPKSQKT